MSRKHNIFNKITNLVGSLRIDVKNIMVKDIITVGKDRTVASAKSLMNYFNLDALIITNEEEPIGLVTSSDIQKSVIEKNLIHI